MDRTNWPNGPSKVTEWTEQWGTEWTEQTARMDRTVGPNEPNSGTEWTEQTARMDRTVGPNGPNSGTEWTEQTDPMDRTVGPNGPNSETEWTEQTDRMDRMDRTNSPNGPNKLTEWTEQSDRSLCFLSVFLIRLRFLPHYQKNDTFLSLNFDIILLWSGLTDQLSFADIYTIKGWWSTNSQFIGLHHFGLSGYPASSLFRMSPSATFCLLYQSLGPGGSARPWLEGIV